MASLGRVRMRRPGTPGPRGGGVYVPEFQRTRLLDAAFAVVSEDGYRRMTARRVSGRAGVSNKTFYDLFTDREDCFLAAFDHAVEELAAVVLPEWEGEQEWATRARAGLAALLEFLDGEPALRRLVFVEALGAGPRVLGRRVEVLGVLEGAVDQGRAGVKAGRMLPLLTAEGVVGAASSVIHTRLLSSRPGSLIGLLNELMAMVVLPYRGQAAAARELSRPISKAGPRTLPEGLGLLPADKSRHPSRLRDLISGPAGRTSGSRAGRARIPFRLTVRTYLVLSAVAELGARGANPNNREVADAAGISDQGQISRLLSRLEGHGLLQNTGGQTQGVPRAWQITPQGEEIVRVGQPRSERTNGHSGLPEVKR
jgi:AcrR family transcriptional regulator/DNA-binding MarR family transcriptional regulator